MSWRPQYKIRPGNKADEPMMKGEKAAMIEYQFKLELDREMVISKVLSK